MRLFCVVPTWKEYPETCIKSIELQNFKPEAVFVGIDEAGDDSEKYLKNNDSYIKTIRWMYRVYASLNIFQTIGELNDCYNLKDNDIICLIDGDDHLAHAEALQIAYRAHVIGAWLTYGSYYKLSEWKEDGDTAKMHRGSYRNDEEYRKRMWRASHLKTFRYGLYRRLKPDWYIGPDGKPLRVCSDLALMFPMMEMAGKERIQHINKPLYMYNDISPDNDHKVRGKEQKDIEYWLRHQEPYHKINSLSGIGENLR